MNRDDLNQPNHAADARENPWPTRMAVVSLACGLYATLPMIFVLIVLGIIHPDPVDGIGINFDSIQWPDWANRLFGYSFFAAWLGSLVFGLWGLSLLNREPDASVRRATRSMLHWGVTCFILFLLCSIAVPNFLYSENLTFLIGRHLDLRRIGRAVEAYRADHHEYPACAVGVGLTAKPHDPTIPSFRIRTPQAPIDTLTTPVAYLKGKIFDAGSDYQEMYGYKTVTKNGQTGWILFSAGMDTVYQLNAEVIDREYSPTDTQPSPGLLALSYDPSNGSTSQGDIWYTSQGFSSPKPPKR